MIRAVEWTPDSLPPGSVWLVKDAADQLRQVEIIEYSPSGLFVRLDFADSDEYEWFEGYTLIRMLKVLDRLPAHEAPPPKSGRWRIVFDPLLILVIVMGVILTWQLILKWFPWLWRQ
jgi:hypothetical protein